MISLNDTHPAPKAVESYRIRKEAMDAAVFTLGPHARHGFEYTTEKCDGRWRWRPTDEVPAPTAAEIKANGGMRSLVAMAAAITEGGTTMAKTTDGKIVPAKLPVPPRRALGKAADASDGSKAIGQPAAPKNEPATSPGAGEGTYDELKASGGLRSEPVLLSPAAAQLGRMGFTDVAQNPSDGIIDWVNMPMPACNGLDIEPHDDLSIPAFLRREKTPEAKEKAAQAMKRIAKQVGPDRTIKNPPDAKAAAKRAEKAKAVEAKFEGTPEHAKAKRAAKAPASAKPAKAKTAAPAKKRASEAPTKMAGMSGETKKETMLRLARSWTTEAAICEIIGWKACMVTLKRAAEAANLVVIKRPGKDKAEYKVVTATEAKV
jgi:hypothetical protein